eukprot:TRINITY_DN4192_c0_g1_i2.p1 TRINITY_DN4192_c0_g1~~TRINITY_DN4192_c0_g1_i2.p1  ORF type:complete len:1269 (-),score=203.50 TRINITY_DN4192_c0_g1_i2:28-3405(-)
MSNLLNGRDSDECVWLGAELSSSGQFMWSQGPDSGLPLTSADDLFNCPYTCLWQFGSRRQPDNSNGNEDRVALCGGLHDVTSSQPTSSDDIFVLIEFGNFSVVATQVPTEGGTTTITFMNYPQVILGAYEDPLLWSVRIGDIGVCTIIDITESPQLSLRCIVPPSDDPSMLPITSSSLINITGSVPWANNVSLSFAWAPPRVIAVSHVATAGVPVTVYGSSFGTQPSALSITFGYNCDSISFFEPHRIVVCSMRSTDAMLPMAFTRNGVSMTNSYPVIYNRDNKHLYKISDIMLPYTNASSTLFYLNYGNLLETFKNANFSEQQYYPSSLKPLSSPPNIIILPAYLATVSTLAERSWLLGRLPTEAMYVGLQGTSNNATWTTGPEAGIAARDMYSSMPSSPLSSISYLLIRNRDFQWYTNPSIRMRFLLEFGPETLTISPSILTTRGGQITISGGSIAFSGRASYLIGDVSCTQLSSVLAGASVRCVVPPGVGAHLPIRYLYDNVSMCSDCAFLSFRPPSIVNVTPLTIDLSSSTATILTITGSNFGGNNSISSINIFLIDNSRNASSYDCINIMFETEHERILCSPSSSLPPGAYSIYLNVGGQTTSYNSSISASCQGRCRPVITEVEPSLIPSFSSSPAIITISGNYLYANDSSIPTTVRVGQYACINIQILISDMMITCELPYLVIGSGYLYLSVGPYTTASLSLLIFSCGDDICSDDETCVTCPYDCPSPCDVCGDGSCDRERGESCSSCRLDCGPCPSLCPGTPECSGRGSCVGGGCICMMEGGWSGPSCNERLANTTASSNGTNVVITPGDAALLSFGIFIVELQEIAQNGSVLKQFPLPHDLFQHVPGNERSVVRNYVTIYGNGDGEDYTSWQFNATLDSGAWIHVEHVYFVQSSVVFYAGDNTTLSKDSVKSTIIIGNFPFTTSSSQLGVVLSQNILQDTTVPVPPLCQADKTPQLVQNSSDNAGSLIWAQLRSPSSGLLLYSTFNPDAIVDGRRLTSYTNIIKSSNSNDDESASLRVRVVVPAFTREAVLDPTFGVLLSTPISSSSSSSLINRDGLCLDPDDIQAPANPMLVVAIVVPIVVVVVVVIVGVVLYKAYRGKEETKNIELSTQQDNDML